MPPEIIADDKADALFQALRSAPLEEHWTKMKSSGSGIGIIAMPTDGNLHAENLCNNPNFVVLCAAIKTCPSGIHTHKTMAKAVELLDGAHGHLLSKKSGRSVNIGHMELQATSNNCGRKRENFFELDRQAIMESGTF